MTIFTFLQRFQLEENYSIQNVIPVNVCVREILGIPGGGEMVLCGIGRNIPEICFGKSGEDSLRDVWINQPAQKKPREDLVGKYPGLCGDCIHSHYRQTECVAVNYALSGELVHLYCICELAKDDGIFPETRKKRSKTAAVGAH